MLPVLPVNKTNQFHNKQKNNVHNGQNLQNKQFNFSKQFDFKQLKLTKMKKQLLNLVLMLVFIAGNTQLFAQNPPHDLPPECNGSAAEPSIGVEYEYTVTIPGNDGYDGTGGFYHWYVVAGTLPIDLLTATPIADGTGFDNTGTPYADYNDPANTINPIRITWQSSALGVGTYYLVIKYSEENSNLAGCTGENIKVYEITPQNTFWLKIENIADATGTAGGDIICPPVVAGATINASGTIEYDFGVSTHFVKVSANGYVGDWTPRLQLSTLDNDMTYGDVEWTAASGATGTFTGTATGGIWTSNNPMPSINDFNATTGWGPGEEIIIEIQVNHNHKEAIADMSMTVGIDGTYDVNGTTYYDKWNNGGTDTCIDDIGFGDTATRTLLARPNVTPGTPATFVGGNNIP